MHFIFIFFAFIIVSEMLGGCPQKIPKIKNYKKKEMHMQRTAYIARQSVGKCCLAKNVHSILFGYCRRAMWQTRWLQICWQRIHPTIFDVRNVRTDISSVRAVFVRVCNRPTFPFAKPVFTLIKATLSPG